MNEKSNLDMYRTRFFPAGYSHWLAERLPGEVIESLATCDNCAMVRPKGLTRDPGPFKTNLKCCTYFPFIPNFGLGAILKDAKNESSRVGEIRLATAMKNGILLPLGLFPSPEHEQKIAKAGDKGFGQRADLLCPFFDSISSGCSIWKNRPGVCATYFCKSIKGSDGLAFWKDLEDYLNFFEWTVANEALWRLGFTNDDLEKCEAVMLTEPGEEREWMIASAWSEWQGREHQLFDLCLDKAKSISKDELEEILGEEGGEIEESLRFRIRSMFSPT
jgi:Fe-S-cluster containining protein